MEYYISLFPSPTCLHAGQAYGRFIQIQPSYYRVRIYGPQKERKGKKAEKTPPNFNT